jgi:Family of unknown function (DUF5906)
MSTLSLQELGYQKNSKNTATQHGMLEENIKYFVELVKTIKIRDNSLEYMGRMRLVKGINYFQLIMLDPLWDIRQKRDWERFIIFNYTSAANFNTWCLQNKQGLSFYTDKQFPLLFKNCGSYTECYQRVSNKNHQIVLISSDKNNRDFMQDCIDHLRRRIHYQTVNLNEDNTRLKKVLDNELGRGFHQIKGEIKVISNDSDEPCHAYIDLDDFNTYGEFPCWTAFITQFATEKMRDIFMAWVYSIFYAKDMGREILWIEGEGNSGKSTIMRVIAKQLMKYNECLFKTLTDNKEADKFALAEIDKCRFIGTVDGGYKSFFARPEIMNLTGNDAVVIREMNKNPTTRIVHAKIMVVSNFPPEINKSHVHETSRLLYTKLTKENIRKVKKTQYYKDFEAGLYREFRYFMRDCKDKYLSRVKDNFSLK